MNKTYKVLRKIGYNYECQDIETKEVYTLKKGLKLKDFTLEVSETYDFDINGEYINKAVKRTIKEEGDKKINDIIISKNLLNNSLSRRELSTFYSNANNVASRLLMCRADLKEFRAIRDEIFIESISLFNLCEK